MIISSLELCTGCTTCSQICPKECIKMTLDEDGFFHPVVDEKKCIKCGLCEKKCPVLNRDDEKTHELEASYAFSLKDDIEIMESTSGGFFYALSRYVFEQNGIVYGAAYNDDLYVEHLRIDNINDLGKLRKSKYVQSRLLDSFKNVRTDLKAGRLVLFSGTPCQVAGLKHFLNDEYSNLITMQLFCAEVISENVWRAYLDDLKKKGINVSDYCFRDKKEFATENSESTGWKYPYVRINDKQVPRSEDVLTKAFAAHLTARKSCYNCKFKLDNNKQYADFAVGDFWGCENTVPSVFNPNGTSAVLVYSRAGKQIINLFTTLYNCEKVASHYILSGNPGAVTSVANNKNREKFLREILRKDFLDSLLDAMEINRGLYRLNKSIVLYGNYNTQAAIQKIVSNSNCSLKRVYCHTSISSVASPREKLELNIQQPSNPFRARMVENDLNKSFFAELQNEDYDVLFIDLLDERFPVVKVSDQGNNSYITYSDAFKERNVADYEQVPYLEWEKYADVFCNEINSISKEISIVIVENYLAEKKELSAGRYEIYSNADELANINMILAKKYKYIEERIKSAKIIKMPTNLFYTSYNHKHGIYPWHLNDLYYEELKGKMERVLLEKENET